MDFGPGTYGLGLLAGALSTLSPCVLPLVPLVLASAVAAHRWGAVALGAGLALSFTLTGIFIATVGASAGVDPETLRGAGAVMLTLFGIVLLLPPLQARFAQATAAMGDLGSQWSGRMTLAGLPGQFAGGALLGIIWSPCVGPTLGAATTLASQGRNLAQISLLMLLFGVGAALPMVLLGSVSRPTMTRLRGRLMTAGSAGKRLLGAALLALGLLILTGAEKPLESWLLDHTPAAITEATTRY